MSEDSSCDYLAEQDSINKCMICGSPSLITDNEEIVCGRCGSVAADTIVATGSEWIRFNCSTEDRSRTGSPISPAKHDQGLSTKISRKRIDASGKPLEPETIGTMQRLRTWDSRTKTAHGERNLMLAFTELEKLCNKLGLGDVVKEKAAHIYRKLVEKQLIHGRSTSAMVTASLYAACRVTGAKRSLRDIVNETNTRPRELALRYRAIVTELDLKVPPIDSVVHINKIAVKAGLHEKTARLAVEILKKAKELMVSEGKNPLSLAATALYCACIITNGYKTQKEIAFAAGVTEVTIRNRYKDLKKVLSVMRKEASTSYLDEYLLNMRREAVIHRKVRSLGMGRV